MSRPLTPVNFSNCRTLVTAARDLSEGYNADGAAACIAELIADMAEYGAEAESTTGRGMTPDPDVLTRWEEIRDAAILVRETVFPNGLSEYAVESHDPAIFRERLSSLSQLLD